MAASSTILAASTAFSFWAFFFPDAFWPSHMSFLHPGVPHGSHGHPLPVQPQRDPVPQGHPFPTTPSRESMFYPSTQHSHPIPEPAFGLPHPDQPAMLDPNTATFSDIVRRYPSRPSWASSGGTEATWPAPAPMEPSPIPQPLPPQAPPTSTTTPPVNLPGTTNFSTDPSCNSETHVQPHLHQQNGSYPYQDLEELPEPDPNYPHFRLHQFHKLHHRHQNLLLLDVHLL